MQNAYVGDIGDFGKYGLLRALAGRDLRLGVVWWLKADADSLADGRILDYLDHHHPSRLRECDPELHNILRQIVRDRNERSVAAIAASGALPPRTIYYAQPVPWSRISRSIWCDEALNATADADLVFHDPDNGLTSAVPTGDRGPKCLTPDELLPYVERGQSLIVYHHQTREAPLAEQVAKWMGVLRDLPVAEVAALTFRRRSVRMFFVLVAPAHVDLLRKCIEAFVASSWGTGRSPHFTLQRHEAEAPQV